MWGWRTAALSAKRTPFEKSTWFVGVLLQVVSTISSTLCLNYSSRRRFGGQRLSQIMLFSNNRKMPKNTTNICV